MSLKRCLCSIALAASVMLIGFCGRNRPPGTPAVPTGPASAPAESLCLYTTIATDPDGDGVSYRFDWGNGDTSEWTGWTQSGTPGGAMYAYSDAGIYSVRAQARDAHEDRSPWSSAHKVAIHSQTLASPTVTYAVVGSGASLRLSWDAVADAQGYRIYTDDTTYRTTQTVFSVTIPTKTIEVTAYSGTVESDAWTLDLCPVVTETLVVWGMSEPRPDRPAGFGFTTDGTAVSYVVGEIANHPKLEFVMEDRQMAMHFYSPNRYDPPFNTKDNGIAVAPGTDFDAAQMVTGDFYTAHPCVEGKLYYFWLDPDGYGWDPYNDHFGKIKVVSIQDTRVTLKLAYQTIPGLLWVRTN